MKCPKCPGQLEPMTFGGVDLDRCRLCFGLWFDRGELEKFNPSDAEFPFTPGKIVPGKPTTLRCPRCHGLLNETPYGPGVDFAVDRCADCHGLWLDADEISKVQRILKGEVKLQQRRALQLRKAAEREHELRVRREEEIADREAKDTLSTGEWLFMFLTRLPREVYHPVRHVPYVTIALIVVNALAFLLELGVLAGPNARQLFPTWGFVPDKVRRLEHLWAIFTSMFLHGGFTHLFGNMYFLYTFGDNVEDYLGVLYFSVLYFLSGLMATVVHFASDIYSSVPTVGASGAIAGILGAYLVLFSRRRIYVLIIFFPVKLRAHWYLGFWIAFQILAAWVSTPGGRPGLAWLAHIGGFFAGIAFSAWYQTFREAAVTAQGT